MRAYAPHGPLPLRAVPGSAHCRPGQHPEVRSAVIQARAKHTHTHTHTHTHLRVSYTFPHVRVKHTARRVTAPLSAMGDGRGAAVATLSLTLELAIASQPTASLDVRCHAVLY